MRRYLVVLALVTTTVLPATGCAPERVPAELVYIGDDEALVLANVDLGRMTVSSTTTVHESGVSFASWSLDGQRLAFVSGEGSDSRLHVGVMKDSALESTYICPVRQGSMGHGDVFWAPTGDWLVVSVGTDWIRGLDLYRLGECELEAELGGAGYQWSPDGKYIMYAWPRDVEPLMPWAGGESMDLVMYELATGTRRELLRGTSEAMFMPGDWPEAGRAFVWRHDRDGTRTLFSFDPTVEGEISLTPATPPATSGREAVEALLPGELRDSFTGGYAWHPDGTAVAVAIRGTDGSEVWILRPSDNGRVDYFLVGPGYSPAWRPGDAEKPGE